MTTFHPDTPPLSPGMFVAYQVDGKLVGGAHDRRHGEVLECRWVPTRGYVVTLTNGLQLHLREIRSVAQVNPDGKVVAAWVTADHGYDGQDDAGETPNET